MMKHTHRRLSRAAATLAVAGALTGSAQGQSVSGGPDEARSLQDQVDRLTRELEVLRGDVTAESTATDPAERLAAYAKHEAMVGAVSEDAPAWQFVGPTNVSGRVCDVAVVEPRATSHTMYAGTASGGLWRTDNDGMTWRPVFEHAASTSIGDVTVAPSDSNVVWIGTGEPNIFRSSQAGAGVYKSTDGGETWKHMGLAGTHTIARILIHPKDPNLVYVCASGHEWTNDDHRGVYRSRDGGETWTKVHFVDEKTAAIDLVMDPKVTTTLYLSTWQRIRKSWNDPRNEVGYSGSSVYKSTDGGDTWKEIVNGLPEPEHRGRIGLDLCATQPNTVYAFIDNYQRDAEAPAGGGNDAYGRPSSGAILGAEVYRSDDGGASWRRASDSNRYMRRVSNTYGWVFGQVRVDPNDPETVYILGVSLHVSNDGGKTFRSLRGMHGDHHALWIDPANSDVLVNGNDGGVAISYDRGRNWRTFYDNLPVVQFFNLAVDMDTPFRVYGSVQDHGSFRGPVQMRDNGRVIPAEFDRAPGGEGCSHAIDPTDVDTVYSAGFYGNITRTDMSAGTRGVGLRPRPPEGEAPYRGQWVAPFILSPHNPRIVYFGLNKLFRSMDRGDGFQAISPDLTHNDPRRLGDIPFQTIFSIAESPFRFGELYVGTDCGRVHRSMDGGEGWKEIDVGLAKDRWIAEIVASQHDAATVYVAQNGKRQDDFTPYLWKSTDRGDTWTSIAGNIPVGPINVVKEDPTRAGVLYVGTDLGTYVSMDGGDRWSVLGRDLPSTYVHDLVVHPRDPIIVIGTHGRGVWALDVSSMQARDAAIGATAER